MIQIYICEDNQEQLENYSKIIKNALTLDDFSFVFTLATSNPYALLEKRKENKNTGLYFLDIDLKSDINGLELAQQIRVLDPRGYIVFITTHSEMMALTFQYKVEAMDFILKDTPEQIPDRIRHCLNTAKENDILLHQQKENNISIKIDNMIVKLNPNDIVYIESDTSPHRLIIHTSHGVKRIPGSLKKLETGLDSRFFRCHNSFLVNMEHVTSFDQEARQLVMDNQERCLVSMRMVHKVKKQILRQNSCNTPEY